MTQSSPATLTYRDVLDFIEADEYSKIRKWSRENISLALKESIAEGSFIYSVGNDGKLNGVCIGKLSEKRYHIVAMQCSNYEGFASIILHYLKVFCRKYPTVTAKRRGKFVELNVVRYLWMITTFHRKQGQ